MIRESIVILFLFLTSLCVYADSQPFTYQLHKEFYPSIKIRVTVDTQKLEQFIVDQSRAYLDDKRADKQVYCADNDQPIAYGMPVSCTQLYWDIEFKKQSFMGVGARAQDDYYLDNGQWILSESKNFPRIRSITDALVCMEQNCKALPSIREPFFFWVWGKSPTNVNIAGKSIEVFSDKMAESINKRALMIQLEPYIRYLNKVFITQLGDHIKRPISIILLKRDDSSLKDAGGVAKDHVAVVNYYTKGVLFAPNWELRFKETMLHEYIHLLSSCGAFPRWTCESLADYYSFKALSSGRLNKIALTIWARTKRTSPANLGLYKLDAAFWQTQNYVYYRLFYTKGAAFWNELDMLLNKKYQSLDNYLGLLVFTSKQYQSTLPSPFVNKMIEILGEEQYKKLSAKYLE